MNTDEARLLPRYRGDLSPLDRHRLHRAQARALVAEMKHDLDAVVVTLPGEAGGDPDALRGLPAIGRSVRGVIRGTDPEGEAVRRVSRAESVRERTELAA